MGTEFIASLRLKFPFRDGPSRSPSSAHPGLSDEGSLSAALLLGEGAVQGRPVQEQEGLAVGDASVVGHHEGLGEGEFENRVFQVERCILSDARTVRHRA